jgi:hypothetical protein
MFNSEPNDEVSLSNPVSYADRLRIRVPGDAKFALGRESAPNRGKANAHIQT